MEGIAGLTLDQYLHTSYSPDCHFVDGAVEERVAGYYSHSRMLGLVAFALDRLPEGYEVCPILRLRVSPTRVRVCDVVVLRADAADEQVPTQPPAICIEILDAQEERAAALLTLDDYKMMGVPNIWLIDLAQRCCYIYGDTAFQLAEENRLTTFDETMTLDMAPLFKRLKD